MASLRSGTAIFIDPGVRGVGVDPDTLVTSLHCLGIGHTMLVPGMARHPELLTRAVKTSGGRTAVVVTAEFDQPPIAELRTWGAAGGLAPLGVQVVALDILQARRSATERSAYAVRMVRSAMAEVGATYTAKAGRRPVGASLSRRGLLRACTTTWVPVVEVDAGACLGALRCRRCIEACPEDALRIPQDVLSSEPVVDVTGCGACSRCLDVCPTGALSLAGHDTGTIAQRLRALIQGGDGAAAPAVIISCHRAAEPVHRMGQRGGLPGWLVLELSCLGGVGSAWHLAALATGARTVQILPCASCRDRASLTKELDFTRNLLAALGDAGAVQRVGVLPEGGLRLRQAILAAEGLTALVDGTGVDRTPAQGAVQSSARVAAWAVGELQRALGTPIQLDGRPVVIRGEGSPLGVLVAAEGCTACGVCARSCPTLALSMVAGSGSTELILDPAACTGCGVCVETCPQHVLDVLPGVDLSLLAGGCVPITRAALTVCLGCGESIPALPADANLTTLPAGLVGRCPRCRQTALVASF
ncbi:MAG: 4Fe-4S binding protein [Actinomycetota bacterium]